MRLRSRTSMYNHFRDHRNDHWAVIFGLGLGWALESLFGYNPQTAIIAAFMGMAAFRVLIWYTPWTESITWESREHIYSTPWQPMASLDELRIADEGEYVDKTDT